MKNKSILFLVVVLSLAGIMFIQGCGQIAGANFLAAKGTALYNAGRYEEAVEPLEGAIKVRAGHGKAHYYLALTYLKLGQKEKAVNLLKSYLVYVKKPNVWLGTYDKQAIPKCKSLLGQLE